MWVVQADEQEEGYHLGGGHPVWSPDGRWLVFSRALQDGEMRSWLAWAGMWTVHRLDLPPDAYVVDWVNLQNE